MSVRALQIFLSLATALLLPAVPARGALSTGNTYSIGFVDLDGQKLSTADGHVTVVVLTTSADREQARTVGDMFRFLSRQSGLQNDYGYSFHRQTSGYRAPDGHCVHPAPRA